MQILRGDLKTTKKWEIKYKEQKVPKNLLGNF